MWKESICGKRITPRTPEGIAYGGLASMTAGNVALLAEAAHTPTPYSNMAIGVPHAGTLT